MQLGCVVLVTRLNYQYNKQVMPKLHFSSVLSSFVSLLSRFVVVAIIAGGLSYVSPSVHAQIQSDDSLDSGMACVRNSDCASQDERAQCINGTCGIPVTKAGIPKPQTKQLEDLDKANTSDKESVFKLTDTINNATLASWLKLLAGCTVGTCNDYDGKPTQTAGALGGLRTAMASTFTQPASAQTAIADALNSAGIPIATPAYAQGIGFSALDPILEAWKVFRNLAYLFFIFAFVIIGFMIMFRQKVGQAAITAQQAIPQIIVALVMVTFSYAIAGLLIDLMYLIMYLLVGIFGEETTLVDLNVVSLTGNLLWKGWTNIGAIGEFVDATLEANISILSEAAGFAADILFLLIITVAIFIGMFRLFFELLKTYVSLIVSIALAPVILMMGAIPGRNAFGSWLQSLVGNLAAFPAVLLVLIIFNTVVESRGISEAGFLPPYLFGSGSGGVIPTLIGLGLILALPEIVVKVKESFGAKDSFGWLTSAAFKNMDRGAPALPIVGGLLGGGYNMATNTGILTEPGRSPLRKAVNYGGEVASGTQGGWKRGMGVLKLYQRMREGRLTQVEDVETLLSRLNAQQGGGSKGSGSH
jgi:hypothetical protein